MTLLIEVLQIDSTLSKRITPFYNVISPFKTYKGALSELYRMKEEYDKNYIKSSIFNNTLVISNDPQRGFAKISYKLENATLYGNSISHSVFHLMRFNGYIIDQDKPYRYDNLGWFCDRDLAKQTKEWKILRNILNNNNLVNGFESVDEIRLYGPYGCTDMNPSLVIREYTLNN